MKNIYHYPMGQFIRDLAYYVFPYRRQFFAGVFFRLTSDIAHLYPALAISRVVQILSRKELSSSFQELSVIFLAWGTITLYFSIFHNFSKYLGFQVAERASLDFYKDTLAHIFKLDFSWQEKENSGNKMKRIDKGQEGINLTIRRIFNVLIEVAVNTVGIVVLFFSLNKGLAISLIFYIVVFFILGTLLLKKAIKQVRIVSKTNENVSGFTFESLNNIQTIKSLAIDTGVLRVIERRIDTLIKQIKKRIFYFQSLYGITNTFSNFYKYFAILYLSIGILQGKADLSLLILFIGLFDRVDTSVGELTDVIQELATAKIWISRAKNILATTPTIENQSKVSKQNSYNPDWKEITIRGIKFSYRKKEALNDVSFNVKRQEKVGVVGLSGAGKSTLFKLFLDLYENYNGDIFLDKVSLKNIQRKSYIDHVAVVLQDTELFDMSLKDNIEIAAIRRSKDPKLLSEVIKMSHLEEVVNELPKGVNTIVGEKGIKLSGGQKQRVGIARALYRQPDILLLDEATSHLDAHSEKEIQRAILENINRFTTIVIAHRLSTIKAMDKIVVLEKGRVVEQGKFEELLEKQGVFARMWQDQKI